MTNKNNLYSILSHNHISKEDIFWQKKQSANLMIQKPKQEVVFLLLFFIIF